MVLAHFQVDEFFDGTVPQLSVRFAVGVVTDPTFGAPSLARALTHPLPGAQEVNSRPGRSEPRIGERLHIQWAISAGALPAVL